MKLFRDFAGTIGTTLVGFFAYIDAIEQIMGLVVMALGLIATALTIYAKWNQIKEQKKARREGRDL